MSGADPSGTGSLLWVLCGAGRGVGKTHLALALCRILPEAAYAKQGAGRRRPGKVENFYRTDEEMDTFLKQAEGAGRRHLVVESNALALRGRGDVIIFLGGDVPAGDHVLPGGADKDQGVHRGARPDADLLRSLAHMVLDRRRPGTDPSAWREVLARKGLESAMRTPVLEVLAAQAEWNGRTRE